MGEIEVGRWGRGEIKPLPIYELFLIFYILQALIAGFGMHCQTLNKQRLLIRKRNHDFKALTVCGVLSMAVCKMTHTCSVWLVVG